MTYVCVFFKQLNGETRALLPKREREFYTHMRECVHLMRVRVCACL